MGTIVKDYHEEQTGTPRTGRATDINNREAQVAHNRAFGDYVAKQTEATGMPGDQAVYWDPMGFLNSRQQAISAKGQMMEKWRPVYEEFNSLMREGIPFGRAAEKAITEKAVDTTSFSLPVFFTPDVYIQDEQDLPAADMLARTAVQENQVDVDELDSTGSASQFAEGATSWPENDDSYSNHSYSVVSYGRQNEVTDFVQLSANTLRSTRALTEDQQVRAIRQYEEAQIFQGTGSKSGVTGNDSNGFSGLSDLADSGNHTDESGGAITVSKVRDQIRGLRRDGASRSDIVHFTDHKTFQDLQEDLDDFTRYESPSDELSFGFTALEIDGTPVMETHGTPNSSSNRMLFSFDASAHYLAMLQDVTMHPLARDAPSEKFATDAYGVLVSESPTRIQVLNNLA